MHTLNDTLPLLAAAMSFVRAGSKHFTTVNGICTYTYIQLTILHITGSCNPFIQVGSKHLTTVNTTCTYTNSSETKVVQLCSFTSTCG